MLYGGGVKGGGGGWVSRWGRDCGDVDFESFSTDG